MTSESQESISTMLARQVRALRLDLLEKDRCSGGNVAMEIGCM